MEYLINDYTQNQDNNGKGKKSLLVGIFLLLVLSLIYFIFFYSGKDFDNGNVVVDGSKIPSEFNTGLKLSQEVIIETPNTKITDYAEYIRQGNIEDIVLDYRQILEDSNWSGIEESSYREDRFLSAKKIINNEGKDISFKFNQINPENVLISISYALR